jgi:hypothetical protein
MFPIADKNRKYALPSLSFSLLSPYDAELLIGKLHVSKLLPQNISIFIPAKPTTLLSSSPFSSFPLLIISA